MVNHILGDNRESGPASVLEQKRTRSLRGPDIWPVGSAELIRAQCTMKQSVIVVMILLC